MNRFVVASLAVAGVSVGLASAAVAADMSPAPAPMYTKAPAPTWSWTGFYVGGNVGYGPGTSNNSLSFSQFDTGNIANFGATDSVKVNGVNGGVQAGYNWQVSNAVFGLETDFQGSGEKGTSTFGGAITNLSNTGNNPASVTDTSKLDWFGTTRARAGLTFDHWLIFATGGVAYGEVNESGSISPITQPGFVPTNQNAPIVWGQSTTKVGWAAGAGVENAITRNWSWKVEYLFMDLGNTSANVSGGVGNIGPTPGNCYANSTSPQCAEFRNGALGSVASHFTDNIVRLGVNYKFNN
jgi:outer membrane immunogenic protein